MRDRVLVSSRRSRERRTWQDRARARLAARWDEWSRLAWSAWRKTRVGVASYATAAAAAALAVWVEEDPLGDVLLASEAGFAVGFGTALVLDAVADRTRIRRERGDRRGR